MILYHVLDLETTGLNRDDDEIAEIAILTCKNTEVIGIFHQYYQVSKMGKGAFGAHGMSINQLIGWPQFSSSQNISYLQNLIKYPVFAHNATFDVGFLVAKKVMKDYHPMVDTLKLCKTSGVNLKNNKLQTWLQHYNLNSGVAHNALNDAFGLTRLIMLLGWQIYAKIGS